MQSAQLMQLKSHFTALVICIICIGI